MATKSNTQTTQKGGPQQETDFKTSTSARHAFDRVFAVLVFAATMVGLVVLAVLLVDIARDGLPRLSWAFLASFPSVNPANTGIYPALLGSLWLLAITAVVSVPLGLEIFVNLLGSVPARETILSGALTLSLLTLPIIIIPTREALRTIPASVREGGYALGATRWEVIRSHLLPMALPGALTGTILALSRAIGEAAPILVVGVSLYQTYATGGPFDGYLALPTQIYDWISRPQQVFQDSAAAGIVVIMAVLLIANSVAIVLRNRYQRRS